MASLTFLIKIVEKFEIEWQYEAYTLYRKMGGMSGSYLYTDENSRALVTRIQTVEEYQKTL